MTFFSIIPQPDEVYRFRSVDALIGSRKELYHQTIYLARPEQLNDPAEATVNVVWRGDEILWPNLITYYWRSFVTSAVTRGLFLPGVHVLSQRYLALEDTPLSAVVENAVAQLHNILGSQRAEELTELSQRNSSISPFELRQLLLKLTPPEHCRLVQDAWFVPLDDFPGKFVQGMGRLLLSQWRVACFTNDFTNPFLWSAYADEHAGVCLVFEENLLQGLQPPEYCESIEMEEVSYELEKPEIEFFTSVPHLGQFEYEKLFTDADGNPSPICPFLPKDADKIKNAWLKQMLFSRRNLLIKQKHWQGEREVRMFCRWEIFADENADPARYTVQYPIRALKGVIFGSRTTREERQAILDVILSKHYVSPIREDFWFTEADPRPDGSVQRRLYSPYVDWRHWCVYPRSRQNS